MTTTVRRKQVRDLTFKLLTEHGLEGWHVRFSSRLTRALGQCNYRKKTITYQQRYVEQNTWEEVSDTVRHEVAHAIAGAGASHGPRWAAVAVKLGANPSATSSNAVLTKKFTGTCPGCGREIKRDQRKNQACSTCCSDYGDGSFNPQFAFVWTRNA